MEYRKVRPALLAGIAAGLLLGYGTYRLEKTTAEICKRKLDYVSVGFGGALGAAFGAAGALYINERRNRQAK